MNKLQNQLYNCVTDRLKEYYPPEVVHQFQLLSPTIPLNDTETIWQFQNQIPPFSLTWNKLVNQNVPFFQQYAKTVANQQPPEESLEKLIGPERYGQWVAHLDTLKPTPSDNKLPTIFSKWAMRYYPQYRNQGKSILSRLVLYNSSIKRLTPYQAGKAIDFTTNMAAIEAVLSTSTTLKLDFDSRLIPTNIQGTWADGRNQSYFGIWSDSSNLTQLSQKFFDSTLRMTIKWNKWAKIDFTTGQWYDSNMLYRVYRSKENWQPSAHPDWKYYFGEKGSMKYFSFALLVVEGLSIQLSSDATYSKHEKKQIKKNAFNGLWPFYMDEATTKVKFNPSDNLTFATTTSSKKPFILGAFIDNIETYISG